MRTDNLRARRKYRQHPLYVSALVTLFYLSISMHGFSFLKAEEAKQTPEKNQEVKAARVNAFGTVTLPGLISQVSRGGYRREMNQRKSTGPETRKRVYADTLRSAAVTLDTVKVKSEKALPEKPVEKPIPIEKKPIAGAGKVHIYLPMKPKDLTVIGFHQAGGRSAVGMKPKYPYSHRDILTLGSRGRGTDPRSAVDIGAPAGTPITSPVDGVVTGVRVYGLYGKLQDYEITVRPSEDKGLKVKVLHVQKPRVKVGQRVYAKGTDFAEVRDLDSYFRSQIAGISSNGSGNHVHIQVNR